MSEVIINGVTYVPADSIKPAKLSEFFIFRCRDAGVHFGRRGQPDGGGNFIQILDSRRLWKWVSKATLSELSQEGPLKVDENKYGVAIPTLLLRISDICEIIPVTEIAASKIIAVPNWEACK